MNQQMISMPSATLRELLEVLEFWLKGQRSALFAAQSLLDNRDKPMTPHEIDQWTRALAGERQALDEYERGTRELRDHWARQVGGLRTIVTTAPDGVM